MPSTWAPIPVSRRHRSWTCGSQAAFTIGRLAGRQRGRHQRVLGAGHGRLVQVHLGAAQPAGGAQAVLAADVDLGAQRCQRHQMGVDAAAADHVAARRRDVGRAEAREQRAGEQDRRADPLAQLGIELGAGHVAGPHAHRVLAQPLDIDAERDDQLDHLLDVPDARDVLERHRVGGQQAGCEDGERGVLVAGRAHGAREGRAALDQERFHSASSGCDRHLDRVATFDAGADGPAWGAILAGRWRTTWCTTATRHGSC